MGTRAPGSRRSTKRTSLFRALPSAPILLGIAALAVSAGGAVSAADPQLVGASAHHASAAIGAAGGAAAASTELDKRGTVVSRGSRRDELAGTDGTDGAAGPGSGSNLAAAAEQIARQRTAAFANNDKQIAKWEAKLKLNQWHLPVLSYHLTARFGDYGLWSGFHTGLDFAAPIGTPIYAVGTGVIDSASYDGSYGNKTVETLADGTELWYCHQSQYGVSVGEHVTAGELIGYIGDTGHTTGPHLHLEVRPGGGDPVDPYQALIVHGVTP